ncbi:DUF4397 domain-containing protein [Mobilitalea sibirica]|uniref:DUF4397 domain-containing protein n=2 Tax=Mobilitalea sibirica TaxID=1462919 RepID=A0A8J7H6W6_9FIRM|nr:DUF4397 domain-containing protein [Mobilitalea sibirica]
MRNNGKGQTNNKSRNSRQATSYIRVLHASPGAPAVDVYADGTLLVSDLAFKEQSMYVRVPSGSYNVTVYPTGQTTDAVIDTTVEIPENAAFNAVAVGTLPDLSLMTIQEPNMPPETDEACVRFVHISPDAPNVDIRLEDGTNVFTDIGYKEESDYVCVDEGTYTFNVNPAGTDTTVLTVPDVSLDAKTYYTIYAVGLVDGTPELEALLITEPREED